MIYFIAITHWITQNYLLFVFAIILLNVLIYFIFHFLVKRNILKKLRHLRFIFIINIFISGAISLAIYFYAAKLTADMIYRNGIETDAKVISVKNITHFADVEVQRLKILYRLEDNTVMEASILNQGGYIYPVPSVYPSSGQDFRLRYLAENPQYFVIIADETAFRCHKIRSKEKNLLAQIEADSENRDNAIRSRLSDVRSQYRYIDCPQQQN